MPDPFPNEPTTEPTAEQIRATLAEMFFGEGQTPNDPGARCFLHPLSRGNDRLIGIHRGNDLRLYFAPPIKSEVRPGDRPYFWETETALTTFVRERADHPFGFRHVVFVFFPEPRPYADRWIRACDFKADDAADVFAKFHAYETARRERNETQLPQVISTIPANRDLSSPKETLNG